MTKPSQGKIRLGYLDGLRGLSIALVLLWHFYGPSEATVLPYGDRYGSLPIIDRGWIGVEMFFLISGFVIFMTLERCSEFLEFMRRRWLRLFPAMLVASILLFAAGRVSHLRSPNGPAWLDLLPGLLLIDPSFLHIPLRVEPTSLSPVFWSLYVEVGFYVIFGLLYFRFGSARAILGLVVLHCVTWSAPTLLGAIGAPPLVQRAVEPLQWLGAGFYGWFASGALFAVARDRSSNRMFVLAVIAGIGAVLTLTAKAHIDLYSRAALGCVLCIFAAAQRADIVKRVLASRALLFLGFVSYPLYLVHNEIGLTLIAWAATVLPGIPPYLWPVPATVVVIGVAWLIARHIEPALTALFAAWITPSRKTEADTRARLRNEPSGS